MPDGVAEILRELRQTRERRIDDVCFPAQIFGACKGQVMKLSKGKANPALVGEILERKLKG